MIDALCSMLFWTCSENTAVTHTQTNTTIKLLPSIELRAQSQSLRCDYWMRAEDEEAPKPLSRQVNVYCHTMRTEISTNETSKDFTLL